MSSSSGNSSGSPPIQNSGSEGDLQVVMDERKRKRMESNRESARRSRMWKQKHLDDLTAKIAGLRKEHAQILTAINATIQNYLSVESENSVLRAQTAELTQRLQSLNEILSFRSTNNGFLETEDCQINGVNSYLNMDPWNMGVYMNFNQPIMASPDIFPY